jgi:hypothetical protein
MPAVRSHEEGVFLAPQARVQPYPCGTARGPPDKPDFGMPGVEAPPAVQTPRSKVAFILRPQAETLSGVEGAGGRTALQGP